MSLEFHHARRAKLEASGARRKPQKGALERAAVEGASERRGRGRGISLCGAGLNAGEAYGRSSGRMTHRL